MNLVPVVQIQPLAERLFAGPRRTPPNPTRDYDDLFACVRTWVDQTKVSRLRASSFYLAESERVTTGRTRKPSIQPVNQSQILKYSSIIGMIAFSSTCMHTPGLRTPISQSSALSAPTTLLKTINATSGDLPMESRGSGESIRTCLNSTPRQARRAIDTTPTSSLRTYSLGPWSTRLIFLMV